MMARVPDPCEDLQSCRCENEEDGSEDLSLDQQSFYGASFGPLPGGCMDKLRSPGTPDTSKMPELAYEERLVLVTARGKVLKKRRTSLSQPTPEDELVVGAGPEEGKGTGAAMPLLSSPEIVEPRPAHHILQSNVKYRFMRVLKSHFILNDEIAQCIIRDPLDPYLSAAALQDLKYAVRFDMVGYKPLEPRKLPVALRLSDTQLFVSAQKEGEPVLLKEMPETPRVITGNETSLLFFWETYGSRHYFRSVTHPELFLATNENAQVHMGRLGPSVTDFRMWEDQA